MSYPSSQSAGSKPGRKSQAIVLIGILGALVIAVGVFLSLRFIAQPLPNKPAQSSGVTEVRDDRIGKRVVPKASESGRFWSGSSRLSSAPIVIFQTERAEGASLKIKAQEPA